MVGEVDDRCNLHTLSPHPMPQRICEIEELARLISRHLVSANRQSTVSLACTCRFIEAPALSLLWEHQDSLLTPIGLSTVMGGEVRDRGLFPTHDSGHRQATEHENSGNLLPIFPFLDEPRCGATLRCARSRTSVPQQYMPYHSLLFPCLVHPFQWPVEF